MKQIHLVIGGYWGEGTWVAGAYETIDEADAAKIKAASMDTAGNEFEVKSVTIGEYVPAELE